MVDSIQHQNVIKHIKRCIQDFTIPRESKKLEEDLFSLIIDLRKDINKDYLTNKDNPAHSTFTLPLSWDFLSLFYNAADLLTYRECLGLAQLFKDQYANNYIHFLDNNALFSKALKDKNPFVMHEHLIHLFNILIDCQNMARGEIPPNKTLLENVEIYQKMLALIAVDIKSLDRTQIGSFKDYLSAFSQYALAISYGEPKFETIFNANLCVKLMNEAHILVRIAKEYERASIHNDDNSLHSEHTINNNQLIDFYTCGQGLFARTAIKSFHDLENHIASLGMLDNRTLTQNFDIGRQRFVKEYTDYNLSHPFYPCFDTNLEGLMAFEEEIVQPEPEPSPSTPTIATRSKSFRP